ncbi:MULTISPECIES: PAS domain S-box protein [unclassified Janthinobacterium]|uniref:PAS domain-containing sensor histidine kinase n=1 Tax=unclassified Janthinobacterium TaxID=2610881 RepID=UPI00161BD081|nr:MULTISPECIES: PAS domain S-box protein [unclassified Janthinobacterium]MBB5608908.1 PAS domain S-box-containing protein [Janthinobacterium sp. S3T4]MBB5615237.1 PAS domain S-box-containing protein [Janthinobacterium sp. S3M3]
MSKWSIETLSAACAALLLILLSWLAGTAWDRLSSGQQVCLALLLAIIAAACIWMMRKLRAHHAATRQQLDDSVLRYRDLAETAQDGMWRTDPLGIILDINQRMSDMLGIPVAQLLGQNASNFHDEATRRRLCPLWREAGQSCMGELHYRHTDGTERWAMVSGRRLYDQHGVLTGSLVLANDISARKRAEQALAQAHAELESRVALRTAQLQDANARLSAEVAMHARTETALAFSEERMQDIISMMPLSLFLKGADSSLLMMNHACEQQWGVRFEQVAGARIWKHFPAEQNAGFRAGDLEAFASRRVVILEELVWNAQLQENRLVQTHKKPVFDADGLPQMVIAMAIDITDSKRNEENLRHSLAQLRELSDHQQTIKEEERRRIALDIHDDLGQNLMALRIDVSLLHARTAVSHPRLHQHAQRVLDTIDATIRSVRTIINDLHPSTLELGLAPAIEWLLRQMEERGAIRYRLTVNSEAPDLGLDQRQTSAIFRVLQESLSNIVRHAQASVVDVALAQEHGHLHLRISDNGVGMRPDDDGKRCAFGLKSIRERVQALGGEMQIDSQPGQGTALAIHVPLASNTQLSEKNA